MWFGNMTKKLDRTTITDRDPAGNVIAQSGFEVDPGQINRTFDKPLDINGAFLDIPVGLGSVDLGSARLYVAVVGSIGWYDFEYKPRFKATGSTTTFSGDGLALGGGGEALLARGPWFGAVSFLYRTNVGTSVDRSPRVPPPAGGSVAQNGDLDFEQFTASARFGRSFRTGWRYLDSLAPFVGFEASWTDVTVTSQVAGTFPDGSSRTFRFDEELENESWRALVGVDAHVSSGLFARLQGSFDGCDQAVLLKFVYRFDLPF
jgi:hypothetical protein